MKFAIASGESLFNWSCRNQETANAFALNGPRLKASWRIFSHFLDDEIFSVMHLLPPLKISDRSPNDLKTLIFRSTLTTSLYFISYLLHGRVICICVFEIHLDCAVATHKKRVFSNSTPFHFTTLFRVYWPSNLLLFTRGLFISWS